MHFLKEVLFLILIIKFWEQSSFVSEVVDEDFERLTIPIQEYFVINCLELMHV